MDEEFTVTLTREQAHLTLCALITLGEFLKGDKAQSLLNLADAIKPQIGLSDFVPDEVR